MYGYNEYIELTPNQLYTKVKQEQIFELVLEQPFSYYSRYTSPIREDKEANCRFEEREDGIILFIDFGNTEGKTHLTCIGLIMELHKTDMQGALSYIVESFKLPTEKEAYPREEDCKSTFTYGKSNDEYRIKSKEDVKQSVFKIDYRKKDYSKQDTLYWSKFIIKPPHLFEDNVHSAAYVTIYNMYKNKRTGFRPLGLCYAIDFLDAVKLYQPYNLAYKWITNCNENHIGNIDNLPETGDKLVICKAYKDHRVLRNLNLGTSYSFIWFHNEGALPSTDILMNLIGRFRQIIVFYDNDSKGIASSGILARFLCMLKANCAVERNIPIKYVLKDIGEFISKEGRSDTIKLLNEINL